MSIQAETSSPWMVEFEKQLVRGKHILLHGNVRDQFVLDGSHISCLDFLRTYFTRAGYEIVANYDIVDGMQFADPDRMQPEFRRIVTQALGGGIPVTRPSTAGAPA